MSTLARSCPPMLTSSEVERFWSKVDMRAGVDCWEWRGPVNNQGYGRFEIYRSGRRRFLAHRLVLAVTAGIDLIGLSVRHSCDNPPCVRPDHLLTGTHAENMRDSVERSRADFSGLAAYRTQKVADMHARIAAGIKRCPQCGMTKSLLEDFHRARGKPDGRQSGCKECHSARQRRGLDPTQRKARRRAWELRS
jgi:hypothetical protein